MKVWQTTIKWDFWMTGKKYSSKKDHMLEHFSSLQLIDLPSIQVFNTSKSSSIFAFWSLLAWHCDLTFSHAISCFSAWYLNNSFAFSKVFTLFFRHWMSIWKKNSKQGWHTFISCMVQPPKPDHLYFSTYMYFKAITHLQRLNLSWKVIARNLYQRSPKIQRYEGKHCHGSSINRILK